MKLWSSPKAARNTEAGYFLHAISRTSEVNSCQGSRHGRAQNFKLDTTINKNNGWRQMIRGFPRGVFIAVPWQAVNGRVSQGGSKQLLVEVWRPSTDLAIPTIEWCSWYFAISIMYRPRTRSTVVGVVDLADR